MTEVQQKKTEVPLGKKILQPLKAQMKISALDYCFLPRFLKIGKIERQSLWTNKASIFLQVNIALISSGSFLSHCGIHIYICKHNYIFPQISNLWTNLPPNFKQHHTFKKKNLSWMIHMCRSNAIFILITLCYVRRSVKVLYKRFTEGAS